MTAYERRISDWSSDVALPISTNRASIMADACCSSKRDTIAELGRKAEQRRVLIIVMLINLAMFVVEFGGGVVARSSALMADSVDMFGDAVVYALSLYALHRGARWEAGAALAKGGIILAFGVAVIFEIADKIANGVPPASGLMLGVGSAALVANLICLALLWRFRRENVNMRSEEHKSELQSLMRISYAVFCLKKKKKNKYDDKEESCTSSK